VTSDKDYNNKHAKIKRKIAWRNETGSLGKRKNARDEDGKNWPVVRKRVIDTNYGCCIFCEKNAEDVHHVLGLKEGHDSRFLIPVCKHHHQVFHSKKYAKDGADLVRMAVLLGALYPNLYMTVRKSARPRYDQYISYAVCIVKDDQVGFIETDPCPGWESTPDTMGDLEPSDEELIREMAEEEEEFRKRLEDLGEDAFDDDEFVEEDIEPAQPRYKIEHFYIVVSETGYNETVWSPRKDGKWVIAGSE
jgi:hypothetical protein